MNYKNISDAAKKAAKYASSSPLHRGIPDVDEMILLAIAAAFEEYDKQKAEENQPRE